MTDHVIIGGFGRVGQTIARLLAAENVPFLALDMDARLVDAAAQAGAPGVFRRRQPRRIPGARRREERARAFVVTLDEADAAERMVAAIRQFRSDAVVLARAIDREARAP